MDRTQTSVYATVNIGAVQKMILIKTLDVNVIAASNVAQMIHMIPIQNFVCATVKINAVQMIRA